MYYYSVIELFDKVLQRLEDDYNVKDYTDNLVEQVLILSLVIVGFILQLFYLIFTDCWWYRSSFILQLWFWAV
jgi:hypothetical protein